MQIKIYSANRIFFGLFSNGFKYFQLRKKNNINEYRLSG